MRTLRLSLLMLIAAFALGAVACVRPASSGRPAALQACVDRWNWMHYGGWFVPSGDVTSEPARVRANPCRIEIAYRPRYSDPSFRFLLGSYFPCRVNRFGAYVCASHAYDTPDRRALRRLNARFFPKRNGRIVLDHPLARRLATPKPEWVRRYEVDHGFIVPFDRRGHPRAGLTLSRARPLQCYTVPDDKRWPYLWGCGGMMLCFAPSLPGHAGELLACPTQAGSRRFFRARYRTG